MEKKREREERRAEKAKRKNPPQQPEEDEDDSDEDSEEEEDSRSSRRSHSDGDSSSSRSGRSTSVPKKVLAPKPSNTTEADLMHELRKLRKLNVHLQRQMDQVQKEKDQVQKENEAHHTAKNPHYGTGRKRDGGAPVPIGHVEAVKDYVKGPEIWRDVKFLSTDQETLQVCKVLIQNMPQFNDLKTDDPDVLQENIENFHELHGSTVRGAINSRRTDCTSALKKAYEKRYMEGKPIPTAKELQQVILRNGLVFDADMEWERDGEFNEGLTDEEQEALLRDRDKWLADQKKAVEKNVDFFRWYWNCLLPPVASKLRWGASLRKHCTITGGHYRKDPEKTLVTDSDEAFVLVVHENCNRRFAYTSRCKAEKKKPDETSEEYCTRWCNDEAGLQKFGGWTNKGRKRCVQHAIAIGKMKKQPHVVDIEEDLLHQWRGGDANPPTEKVQDNGSETGDRFGGEDGRASFLGWSFNADGDDVALEDLEDLEDKYQKPKKKKQKKAQEMPPLQPQQQQQQQTVVRI